MPESDSRAPTNGFFPDPYAGARRELVLLLAELGIRDRRVLEAIERVPRHEFVPEALRSQAYDNSCLPIGKEQTISQPIVVAMMTEMLGLEGQERVLEVGTGSGYQAAILSLLAREVFTLERIPELQRPAAERLQALGYGNVIAISGDGSLGLPEHAPFDGIIVTAACPRVPRALLEQLADGGRLVIPTGDRFSQSLQKLTRAGEVYHFEEGAAVRFVPLLGEQGF